jgi:hypothetical protein
VSEQKKKELKEDLKDARENAADKAEELSELIARMREYESGECVSHCDVDTF